MTFGCLLFKQNWQIWLPKCKHFGLEIAWKRSIFQWNLKSSKTNLAILVLVMTSFTFTRVSSKKSTGTDSSRGTRNLTKHGWCAVVCRLLASLWKAAMTMDRSVMSPWWPRWPWWQRTWESCHHVGDQPVKQFALRGVPSKTCSSHLDFGFMFLFVHLNRRRWCKWIGNDNNWESIKAAILPLAPTNDRDQVWTPAPPMVQQCAIPSYRRGNMVDLFWLQIDL